MPRGHIAELRLGRDGHTADVHRRARCDSSVAMEATPPRLEGCRRKSRPLGFRTASMMKPLQTFVKPPPRDARLMTARTTGCTRPPTRRKLWPRPAVASLGFRTSRNCLPAARACRDPTLKLSEPCQVLWA